MTLLRIALVLCAFCVVSCHNHSRVSVGMRHVGGDVGDSVWTYCYGRWYGDGCFEGDTIIMVSPLLDSTTDRKFQEIAIGVARGAT